MEAAARTGRCALPLFSLICLNFNELKRERSNRDMSGDEGNSIEGNAVHMHGWPRFIVRVKIEFCVDNAGNGRKNL